MTAAVAVRSGRSSSRLTPGATSAAVGASMLEESYFSAPVAAGPDAVALGASEDFSFLGADVLERLPPGAHGPPASTSVAYVPQPLTAVYLLHPPNFAHCAEDPEDIWHLALCTHAHLALMPSSAPTSVCSEMQILGAAHLSD